MTPERIAAMEAAAAQEADAEAGEVLEANARAGRRRGATADAVQMDEAVSPVAGRRFCATERL